MAKKVYDFQKTEPGSWQSPKYIEATKKAIETLESEQYKNVLTEADFGSLPERLSKERSLISVLLSRIMAA